MGTEGGGGGTTRTTRRDRAGEGLAAEGESPVPQVIGNQLRTMPLTLKDREEPPALSLAST